MTTYTNRLKFPVPDFALKPWQANLLTCFQQIDETIYQSIINAGTTAWGNSVPFVAGAIAVDTVDGSFYICLVSHTASATGTFAEDRDAHPGYWGLSTQAPEAKGAWVAGTAYSNTDFVTFNNGFYICTVSHTADNFSADLAAGYWAVLIDLAPVVASINASLTFIAEFEDTYLGSKASAPTLDNNGGALKAGDMYFDTVGNALNIYNGSAWVAITAGAPDSGDYVVKTANGSLSAERVATDSGVPGGAIWDWSLTGQVRVGLRATGADKMLYSTGTNAWAEQSLSAFIRTLLDDTTAAAARATLGTPSIGGDTFTGPIITAGSSGGVSSVGASGAFEVRGGGTTNAAYISFHRPGVFAANFGLDSDNVWRVGGWSYGAVAYTIRHTGNMGAAFPEIFNTINSRISAVAGTLYFGDGGTRYVHCDGTYIHANSPSGLLINGNVAYHTGNLTPGFSSAIYGLTNYGGGQIGLNLNNNGGIGQIAVLYNAGGPIAAGGTGVGNGNGGELYSPDFSTNIFGTWRNMNPYTIGGGITNFMRVG